MVGVRDYALSDGSVRAGVDAAMCVSTWFVLVMGVVTGEMGSAW